LTVIEKFEENADVQYALVLLTPDDIGYEVADATKPEEERDLRLRARQNVIFELGYFVGARTLEGFLYL
jgi:predicted nucleotide-binding protein